MRLIGSFRRGAGGQPLAPLLFALALLECDGRLMLLNWIGGIVAVAFFGISSGQLLTYLTQLGNSLLS